MQINATSGEVMVILALALIALFWLMPTIAKKIVNLLKGTDKKNKE